MTPPVFVLGCPRSGNTMLGQWLGTLDDIHYLGEYGGFYITQHMVPNWGERLPTQHWGRYLDELRLHAVAFATAAAIGAGKTTWCDSTPWNIAIVDRLAQLVPDAVFVFTVRNHRGVVQSLRRLAEQGWDWAGADTAERATIWSQFNTYAAKLPDDRLVISSYDELCSFPRAWMQRVRGALESHGVPAGAADDGALAVSWANAPDRARPTVGRHDAADGDVVLARRERYEAEAWSSEDERAAEAIIAPVRSALAGRWPWLSEHLA